MSQVVKVSEQGMQSPDATGCCTPRCPFLAAQERLYSSVLITACFLNMPRKHTEEGCLKFGSLESMCRASHPTLGLRGPQLEGPAKEPWQEEARGQRASAGARQSVPIHTPPDDPLDLGSSRQPTAEPRNAVKP
ncbi:uncharacterized protein [Globicephala melas]|uniref:uncharacterized protein isoform X2 n=1 Tax=Globicephala melas TaxID=9731 RepID=UPI003872BCDB